MTYLTQRMQPEGLRESSRWSQTTGQRCQRVRTLEGCQILTVPQRSRTPPGCNFSLLATGGLRDAPTTGYFLSTLRVEVRDIRLSQIYQRLSQRERELLFQQQLLRRSFFCDSIDCPQDSLNRQVQNTLWLFEFGTE